MLICNDMLNECNFIITMTSTENVTKLPLLMETLYEGLKMKELNIVKTCSLYNLYSQYLSVMKKDFKVSHEKSKKGKCIR